MEIEHILNAVSTSDDEDNYILHEDKSIRPSDKKKNDNGECKGLVPPCMSSLLEGQLHLTLITTQP